MENYQFDSLYAKFYDLLYQDKPYREEAEYIDALIRLHSPVPRESISLLDLACGTGTHLHFLREIGYQKLSGSDISSKMIEEASVKHNQMKPEIKFYNYSFQKASSIPDSFDVIISMFSSINYLTNYGDQKLALSNIFNLLKKDGIFIFDFWNGNAVSRDYSPVRVLRKKKENKELIRISETEIDRIKQSATVKFSCLYFEDGKKEKEFQETHHLHYYYFSEIYNLLEIAGFEVLDVLPFMKLNTPLIDPFEWNITMVCKRKAL